MKKKRPGKAKEIRNLKSKTVSAKSAKGVKGGSLSLNFNKIEYEYKPQGADGAQTPKK